MASNFYKFTDTAKRDLDEILNYLAKELCNDIAAKKYLLL